MEWQRQNQSQQKREARLTFRCLGESARLASGKVIFMLEHDDKSESIKLRHHLLSRLLLENVFKVEQTFRVI